MTFDNITDMQVGSTKVESAWFNGQKVWPTTTSANWYGVKFIGSATTGERTGDLNSHKTLPLQSQMKGCTITGGGVIKWLNPTDWTKYEDGTAIDSTLNVMVYVPDYYLEFIHNDDEDSDEIRICSVEFENSVLIKGGYCSAYEAYNESSVLKSKKGVIPTVNTTRADFETYARANGSEHWNMYTYQAHKAITWLFVVEYANRNCQDTYNANLTSEGYHQGGLGEGVTTGLNDGAYSFVPTGTTDTLCNNSGVVSYQTSAITVSVPRYRGIENPFGHVWKNVIDVIITGTDNSIYLTNDYLKFGNNKTDYQLQSFKTVTTNGYVSQITNNSAGDLFSSSLGGSATTYYCDYSYTNPITTDRTLLIGGGSDNESNAGLFYLSSDSDLDYSGVDVGSRLVYIP